MIISVPEAGEVVADENRKVSDSLFNFNDDSDSFRQQGNC